MAQDPFCSNCGYSLRGLTESSKCPECGKPIVDVLERHRNFPRGRRYTSPIVIFGLPLIHIALGPDEKSMRGHARGIIAIGDIARGWLAMGGVAIGIFAFGGVGIGVVSLSGCAIGVFALGGAAFGGAVMGGGAIGVVAQGGAAIGVVANGGTAVGCYARGQSVYARHGIDFRTSDPEAVQFFDRWSHFLGRGTGPAPGTFFATIFGRFDPTFPFWIVGSGIGIGCLCALIVLMAYSRRVE